MYNITIRTLTIQTFDVHKYIYILYIYIYTVCHLKSFRLAVSYKIALFDIRDPEFRFIIWPQDFAQIGFV